MSDRRARPHLLRHAQNRLGHREADNQAAILDALRAHTALLDPQGFIVSVNETWRQFADANVLQSPHSGIGLNYLAICDEAKGADSSEACAAAEGIRSVLAGARRFSLEYPCHSPTQQRWFLLTAAPLTGSYGAVVMHLNITDQRRVERELRDARVAALVRESAQRYNFLADTVPLIIWTARPDGGLDYYNKAWFDYTGLTLAQTENWGWDAVVHPDDLQGCVDRWTRSFTTGEDYEIEYRFKRAADGTYRWFLGRASALRNENGKIVQWVGTGTDIDDQKMTEAELRIAQSALERRVAERTAELSTANEVLQAENEDRRRTENALRESNEKFHQLANNITDAFWIRSADFSEVQYVSPAFEQIWGRPVATLKANPLSWADFVVADDRARVQDAFATLTKDAPSLDIEYRIARPDGEIRWVRSRGFQVRNDADELIRHIGIVTDITERRQTEQTLRDREALLRIAGRTAQLAGWAIELPGGQVTWSDGVCAILDELPGTVPGLDQAFTYYAPQSRSAISQAVTDCGQRGAAFDLELEVITAKGRPVWVRCTGEARRDASGAITGVQGAFQDITTRTLGVEALRVSERRFKTLFEQAAVGVAQADATTGRFVQVNLRLCEMLGRGRQELQQLTIAEVTHPEDLRQTLEMMRQLKAGITREFTAEKRYLRKDGSVVWANVTVSAMWASGETPNYFIAIVHDVTVQKKLEEQFRQAQKMEAIGTMAGGIAHDFNNILAAITGYTELSSMLLKENPEVRDCLGAILQASNRATELVAQILTFSRQQQPERRPLQLQPIVMEALKLLRVSIPSTIEFETSLATDTPVVSADSTQILQVLMNLGTNAWHAMKNRPGRLHVKTERCLVDVAHPVPQARLNPGIYARLSISDSGGGMDQQTLRRIFEPFFTTKQPGEGTGLGLAVVHGIMASHDGAVTVDSEPGIGTAFHLYFPAWAGEAILRTTQDRAVPRGHGEQILFVDDEVLLAGLGEKSLTELGYAVEVTTQPAAALAMVRLDPQRFSLVITDHNMPGMSGMVLSSELRKIRPQLPIIMLTGYGMSLTPERLKEAGILQLLLKPISFQLLGAAVHAALYPQPPL